VVSISCDAEMNVSKWVFADKYVNSAPMILAGRRCHVL